MVVYRVSYYVAYCGLWTSVDDARLHWLFLHHSFTILDKAQGWDFRWTVDNRLGVFRKQGQLIAIWMQLFSMCDQSYRHKYELYNCIVSIWFIPSFTSSYTTVTVKSIFVMEFLIRHLPVLHIAARDIVFYTPFGPLLDPFTLARRIKLQHQRVLGLDSIKGQITRSNTGASIVCLDSYSIHAQLILSIRPLSSQPFKHKRSLFPSKIIPPPCTVSQTFSLLLAFFLTSLPPPRLYIPRCNFKWALTTWTICCALSRTIVSRRCM